MGSREKKLQWLSRTYWTATDLAVKSEGKFPLLHGRLWEKRPVGNNAGRIFRSSVNFIFHAYNN